MTVSGRTKAAAFSLLELLIVVSIILVLFVMYFNFVPVVHHRTQSELCSDNLQKIFLAMQIYANDFGQFPKNTNAQTSEQVLGALVPRYTSDTSIFICPNSHDPDIPSGAPLDKCTISYAYYMGYGTNMQGGFLMSDRQVNTLPKDVGDQVFSSNGRPPGNNHDKGGGNILFCDGSVQTIPPQATISLAFSNGIVLLNPKP
jgi:prepilin-type processing-associated H-X9-DG protein